MKELEIFDLYEKSVKDKNSFLEETKSTLRVQTDYEKLINDTYWIEIIETTLPYIENIFHNPNRFIVNEEEIVKIEKVRKVTVESIKHLTKNTNFIQKVDKVTGDVTPSKILNINKEESYDTYENRLIYTLVQQIKYYVTGKKKKLQEVQKTNEKNDKQIEYNGNSTLINEEINIKVNLNTKLKDDKNSEKSNLEEIMEKITLLEKKITEISNIDVYKIIDKLRISLIRPPIKKTNVVLKNVNFQYAVKLWDFLQSEMEKDNNDLEHINEKKDYMDESELKDLLDETFLLQYLALNTIDKDSLENEETNSKIVEETTNKMVEKIVDVNSSLSEEELQRLISSKLAIIKYRNQATLGEIQKVFKEHIEKYIENIG